jgi:acyl-CoA thioesterase
MTDSVTDPIRYARDVVGKDPMASFLGIVVEEVREGYARTSLAIRPEYLNAVDRAHGIAVLAAADQALAVASNSTGSRALSLQINISYVTAALPGETITAEAIPVSRGKKVSHWRVEVRGADGRLVATCEGITYHK